MAFFAEISNRRKNLNTVAKGLAVICLIAWVWKESVNPYRDFWFYRTFLEQGFNVQVVVKVDLDGVPYTIQRVIRCGREAIRHELFNTEYSFFPDYYSFGARTPKNEGIIVVTPAVCTERHGRNRSLIQGERFNIPVGYIPLMGILDNVEKPKEIILYASQQAFTGPNARLRFSGITAKLLTGFEGAAFFSDSADEFSFFAASELQSDRLSHPPRAKKWQNFSFVKIPKEIWSDPRSRLHLPEALIARLQKADHFLLLDSSDTSKLQDPGFNGKSDEDGKVSGFGYGLFPGPLFDNRSFTSLNKTMYYDQMMPFRLNGDVWEADTSNAGRFVLINPDAAKDNRARIDKGQVLPTNKGRQMWARKVKFDNSFENYEYAEIWPKSRHPIEVYYAAYLPITEALYVPMLFKNEIYQIR